MTYPVTNNSPAWCRFPRKSEDIAASREPSQQISNTVPHHGAGASTRFTRSCNPSSFQFSRLLSKYMRFPLAMEPARVCVLSPALPCCMLPPTGPQSPEAALCPRGQSMPVTWSSQSPHISRWQHSPPPPPAWEWDLPWAQWACHWSGLLCSIWSSNSLWFFVLASNSARAPGVSFHCVLSPPLCTDHLLIGAVQVVSELAMFLTPVMWSFRKASFSGFCFCGVSLWRPVPRELIPERVLPRTWLHGWISRVALFCFVLFF